MAASIPKTDPSDSYWAKVVATATPKEIADKMLTDALNLDAGYSASPLAMHLPRSKTKHAMEIASYLTPATDLDPEIKRFLYEKMCSRLREANQGGDSFEEPPLPVDGYLLASEMDAQLPELTKIRKEKPNFPPEEQNKAFKDLATAISGLPTGEEIQSAMNVLEYMISHSEITPESLAHLHGARTTITQYFLNKSPAPSQQELEGQNTGEVSTFVSSWDNDVRKYHVFRPPIRQRVCYICRFLLKEPHPLYKSMCKTALVTGARVNLGYRTALQLLRCGARVMATTRYPNDAAVRYSKEPDFEEWKDRLKVIGADFRTARDAFGLVKATQTALQEWGVDRLDILINNAAQTLTDSIKKEERAIVREQNMSQEAATTNIIQQTHYQPRVRGGVTPLALYGTEGENSKYKPIPLLKENITTAETPEISLPDNVKDDGRTELAEPYFKSSWVQELNEIPYEDIISAHAVNAFVPLILCRELLPLMGELKHNRSSNNTTSDPASTAAEQETSTTPPEPSPSSTASTNSKSKHKRKPNKPQAYIINISSREGLFETRPIHSSKKGHHVHTNMTKAAINMIVQTEASSAWESRLVSMNTVDPGYMSAAPEMDTFFDGLRPLDWEDGVGRVLWPVAIGEVEGRAVWGRFLKHFGAGDVRDSVER